MMIDYKGDVNRIMKEVKYYPEMPDIMKRALSDKKNMRFYSDGLFRLHRMNSVY